MEQGGMDENQNNYILSFIQNENGYALSYCDVSTGELKATNFEDESTLINEIITINPNEIVVREDINEDLKNKFHLLLKRLQLEKKFLI